MNISEEQLQFMCADKYLKGYFAMKAIQWVARTGQPMPEELMPWLDAACDAYIEKQGQRFKSRSTARKNDKIVQDVHMLRKHSYTRNDAIAAVAKRDNVAASSVERYYKAGDNEAKKGCDKFFQIMDLLDKDDPESAEALRAFSPLAIITMGVKRK